MLLATHYLDEAQRLADRIIVLDDGQRGRDASPGQLRARGGMPVIRLRLPPGTALDGLPARLARTWTRPTASCRCRRRT